MIGLTLHGYIALNFLRNLALMIIGLALLIATVDFIEFIRRAADIETVSLWQLYGIALLRTPLFVEKAFPFACLFAAMRTLTQMNSKMELVVARAAGVSAWQFLLPISMSAILVGALLATVYNPLSTSSTLWAKNLQAELLSERKDRRSKAQRDQWIKQEDIGGGHTILNAEVARKKGTHLSNVKILRFSASGDLISRIDAKRVIHLDTRWQLVDAKFIDSEGQVTEKAEDFLETSLTRDQLLGITGKPDEVSFWELRETAERVEKSGTNGNPYKVQFYSLTAMPAFLFAMILVAACVCLKFVRFGQLGRMILGGIICGFVLYTVSNLVTALGSNGVVSPAIAAWSPGFVAILISISVLLHQEDG